MNVDQSDQDQIGSICPVWIMTATDLFDLGSVGTSFCQNDIISNNQHSYCLVLSVVYVASDLCNDGIQLSPVVN